MYCQNEDKHCSDYIVYYFFMLLTQYCAGDKIEKNEMG